MLTQLQKVNASIPSNVNKLQYLCSRPGFEFVGNHQVTRGLVPYPPIGTGGGGAGGGCSYKKPQIDVHSQVSVVTQTEKYIFVK